MNQSEPKHRLAAVLSAVIDQYARLMNTDEDATIDAGRQIRSEIILPVVNSHLGRVVKHTGDGFLAEFTTVTDAVLSAVDIQEAVSAWRDGRTNAPDIKYRMGINLGDITVDDDDIHGDGVNISARLRGLAEPGGIAISGSALDQVRRKLDLEFEDLGQVEVKNIAQPVQTYRLAPSFEPKTAAVSQQDNGYTGETETALRPPREYPSVAVLPFDNLSGDPEQEFFGDGLAEDVITALSKISGLRVIARNSCFAYKGTSPDVRKVARELGVRYVVEGSVRRSGDRIRVNVQLVEAGQGSQVWAERYDRRVEDLFDVQDEINKEIVTALRVQLTDGEEALIWARGTNNIDAWSAQARGADLIANWNLNSTLQARKEFETAVRLDPEYASAWANLGTSHWFETRVKFSENNAALIEKARECLDRAMALDDTLVCSLGLMASVAISSKDYDTAVACSEQAAALHPQSADARTFLGWTLSCRGDHEHAIEVLEQADRMDPFLSLRIRGIRARALDAGGRELDALKILEAARAENSAYFPAVLQLTSLLARLGRTEEAKSVAANVADLAPGFKCSAAGEFLLMNDRAFVDRFTEGLVSAGLPH